MNFDINVHYKSAIENFVWSQAAGMSGSSMLDSDIDQLVNEVGQKIIGADKIRPNLIEKANRELSLSETCYLIVQSQDSKLENPTTVSKIENASTEEKTIAQQVVKNLTPFFSQVNETDLKAATLLLGIQRIHELASPKIIAMPQPLTEIEQLEEELAGLIKNRSKYDSLKAKSEGDKKFLMSVDKVIKEKTELLAYKKQLESVAI